MPDSVIAWEVGNDGYRYIEVGSSYASLKQRWIIINSEQAYAREKVRKESGGRYTITDPLLQFFLLD
ncbi:MAG: hypothetical protein KBD37_03275 [Burkholderiales bacterium]|nr:hypothetical protein [Burkholderiales bacterium]